MVLSPFSSPASGFLHVPQVLGPGFKKQKAFVPGFFCLLFGHVKYFLRFFFFFLVVSTLFQIIFVDVKYVYDVYGSF